MSTHGGPETQASDNQSLSRLARVSRNKVSLEPVRIPRDGTIMPLIKGDIDAAADLSWTVLPHCFGPSLSLRSYFVELYLDKPSREEDLPSLAYEAGGEIAGVSRSCPSSNHLNSASNRNERPRKENKDSAGAGASSKGSLRGLSLPQVLSRVSGHHRSLNP